MNKLESIDLLDLHRAAFLHGAINFSRLVIDALHGDDWAHERIEAALAVSKRNPRDGGAELMRVIRATDLTRPKLNKYDAAALASVSAFSFVHNEIAFCHLVTAASMKLLWALDRIEPAMEVHDRPGHTDDELLAAIKATDTSRPDRAIARNIDL